MRLYTLSSEQYSTLLDGKATQHCTVPIEVVRSFSTDFTSRFQDTDVP